MDQPEPDDTVDAPEPSTEPAVDAAQAWQDLAADPSDPGALERAASDPRDSEALAAVLTELASADGESDRATLFRRAAEVFEHELSDLPAALAAWQARAKLRPDEEASAEAVRRLARAAERWDLVVAEYEARAAADDPERWLDWELKIGDVLERTPDTMSDAVARYEGILEREPDHAETVDRLEAIHSEREDWPALVALWQRVVEGAEGERELALARNLAVLHGEVLGDTQQALRWHERVLALAPEDAQALAATEQALEALERWDDLAAWLDGRLDAAEDKDAALRRLAKLQEERLEAPTRAAALWERVLAAAAGDEEALTTLARLYREQGEWGLVINLDQRRIDAETDPEARARLRCKQAAIAQTRVDDLEEAARLLELALEEVPGFGPAVDALTSLHEGAGDLVAQIALLERRAAWAEDATERTELHLRIAALWRDQVTQHDKVVEHLEHALEHDPACERALAPLGDHYMEAEAWAKALPLLDVLANRLQTAGDRTARAATHRKLAVCAEALLDDARALEEYAAAEQLGDDDPAVRQALARLSYKLERHAEAEQWYGQILTWDAEAMAPDEVAAIHARMGQSALAVGAHDRAVAHVDQALALLPDDVELLTASAAAKRAIGDHAGALAQLTSLADKELDTLKRHALWIEVGDLARDPVGDLDAAVVAYEKALEARPDARAPIIQLVAVHAQAGAHADAVRWLQTLAGLEEDPVKRARVLMGVAEQQRDQLSDNDAALTTLEEVLDLDVTQLDAFRTIDTILTERGDGRALEATYRRMIGRVQAAPEGRLERREHLLFLLFRSLGRLYRDVLQEPGYAIQAYEVACSHAPHDGEAHAVLADLYAQSREHLHLAADHYLALIRGDPGRFDLYHRLLAVYRHLGQPDRVWCVTGLLVGFDQAEAPEQAFYEHHLPHGLPEHGPAPDEEAWLDQLLGRGDQPIVGQVLTFLYEAMSRDLPVRSLRQLGLHKRQDRVDLTRSTLVATVVQRACLSLGLPLPDAWRVEGQDQFSVLPLLTPALGVGSALQSGRQPADLAIGAAQALVYLHPWRWMANVYSEEQLELIYLGAIRLFDPTADLRLRSDRPEAERAAIEASVEATRKLLKRDLSRAKHEYLAGVFGKLWSGEERANIAAWHRHCELTSLHAAVHASGDIARVIKAVRTDALASRSKLTRSEKLRDLVAWVLGDDLARVRAESGVALVAPPPKG